LAAVCGDETMMPFVSYALRDHTVFVAIIATRFPAAFSKATPRITNMGDVENLVSALGGISVEARRAIAWGLSGRSVAAFNGRVIDPMSDRVWGRRLAFIDS
jgi:hypothetical protein